MNKSAFTLIEMIVAVVIIGVLASLALTRYGNVVEKQRADIARKHLEAIFAASDVYFAQAKFFPSGVNEDLAFINETFRTNIPDDGLFTYRYTCAVTSHFQVTATRSGGAYTLEIQNSRAPSDDIFPPVCTGSCP